MQDKISSLKRMTKIRGLVGLLLVFLIVSGSLVSLYTINSQDKSPEITLSKGSNQVEPGFGEIEVHVTGAVKKAGVYALAKGSRVEDALAAAEGLGEEADRGYVEKNLNLAARLADGEKIYIPTVEETSVGSSQAAKESGSSAPVLGAQTGVSQGEVNINTATIEDLLNAKLYRIGPKTAEKIVKYREENGPFPSISEIMNVSGIGEKTFEEIKGRITVE